MGRERERERGGGEKEEVCPGLPQIVLVPYSLCPNCEQNKILVRSTRCFCRIIN